MNIETCYKDMFGREPLISIDHDKLYRLEYNNGVDLVRLVCVEAYNTPIFYSVLDRTTFKQDGFSKIIEAGHFKKTDYKLKEMEE